MKIHLRLALAAAMLITLALPAAGRKPRASSKTTQRKKTDAAQIEAATRLQVFLDRANFSPGVINGGYSEFTWKALVLYRQSRGEPPPAVGKPDTAPDTGGLDLGSIGPAVIAYAVAETDVHDIGPVPRTPAEEAKLTFLPYRDPAEAIAEKFHCDVHFLEHLNPGKTKGLKAGDQLMVPNVEPFELASVKDLQPGSESPAANELPDENGAASEKSTPAAGDKSAGPAAAPVHVRIDTKTNMLGVFEADKLVAAYPVTVGSKQTASPIGE